MQGLAISFINFYQRRLSPYKGYRCAHRVHHGGLSCSEFVKRAILADGLMQAYPTIRQRFAECRHAYAALQVAPSPPDQPADPKPSNDTAAKHGDACANVCTMPCL